MTTRERFLIVAGLVVGLFIAGVVFGVSRFIRPESSAAKTEEMAAAGYETGSENTSNQHQGHQLGSATTSEGRQPSQSAQLTEDEQRSIGLQTAVVHHQLIRRQLLAVARVEEPEAQLANISARIGGRIDKLHVDYTGQPVRRGQSIAEIYSPEILTSAEEYKLALENRKRLGSNAEPLAVSGADELIAASRRRLELWGLTPQQIDTIASSDKPQIDLTIYSPASGIVSERKVTQGQYVNAGDVLYTVTDLSTIWVKADVYEGDLPQVHVGQAVEITSESLPGTKLRGQVGFLEPMVNGQTRTIAARIQVSNPGMRLRPGMFVQARFVLTSQRELAVPRSAVVDTGTRTLVYVAKGNGEFEAHDVQLGPVGDDYYPVLAGLRDGDRIVTEGNFLLDSQTRITGGMSGMFGGSKEFNQQQAAPDAAQFKVLFRSDPATPQGGAEAVLHVSVQDAAGKPVTDAQVQATLFMPAMPAMGMAEMRETAVLGWKGSDYEGRIKVPTPGTWAVTVEVTRGGQLLTSYRSSLNAK
ncbi:MAG: efflux RND transporter periplasmic adaptor subunit [Acidobacteriia bacterium]|nr:efflux RND transporter periplasmic adaptor subunit [Terriglobia bacterium]